MVAAIDGWSEAEGAAVLAAMADVAAHAGSGTPSPGARSLVDAAGTHLFGMDPGAGSPAPSDPDHLAASLDDPGPRQLALQLLVLVAYADTKVDPSEVARIDEYATSLDVHPDTLADLHRVRDGHIRRLLVDYFRRAATGVQMHDDTRGIVRRTIDEIHQYVGDPALTQRYLALASLPEGTLGRSFFEFYRARGFSLPGEHRSLGEEVVSHDCCHILAGFNTDGSGEIDVAGFEAGMKADEFGWEMVLEVLLDFQLGIDFGVGLVGYVPKVGELDPDQLMVGIRRGLGCTVDLMGPDWDFWAVADRPVVELRDEYGIVGPVDVLLDPPERPATGS